MGNIFQYAAKILTITAKLVIAALTTSPATPPQPTHVAAQPPAVTQIQMIQVDCPISDRCFKTSDGKVLIFRDARSILP